jgi:hypothetical protein
MTDDETLRQAIEGGQVTSHGRMWTAPIGTTDGPWEFVGYAKEPIRFTAGHAQVTLTLDLCQRCRGPLIIINGKIQGQATFRLDDGDVKITPHRLPCSYPGTSW